MAKMFSSISDILKSYAQIAIDMMKANLDRSYPHGQSGVSASANATSALKQSIAFDIKIFGSLYTMEISMEDFWKFVDEGVKGSQSAYPSASASPFQFKSKMPPPKVFSGAGGWIAAKGIPVRSEVKKSLRKKVSRKTLTNLVAKCNLSMAWAMAKSIQRHGVAATKFAREALSESWVGSLQNDISKAIEKDIIISIQTAQWQ